MRAINVIRGRVVMGSVPYGLFDASAPAAREHVTYITAGRGDVGVGWRQRSMMSFVSGAPADRASCRSTPRLRRRS